MVASRAAASSAPGSPKSATPAPPGRAPRLARNVSHGVMKDVETVRIELQYSRVGLAVLAAMAFATAALLVAVPLAGAMRVALLAGTAVLALEALDRVVLVRGLRAVRMLSVQRDGAIEVESPSGVLRSGRLRPGSFVAPWLVVVRWRPRDARWDGTVLLLPDMVAAEDFRRLRVLLRWA